MTGRSTLNDDYLMKIKAINAVVRGWANYYRAVNPARVFAKLDRYVWIRLRRWLEKKHRISPKQVERQYMYRQKGPKGGKREFGVQDENGEWKWRYQARQTKLIHYRPTYKRHWPNPFLQAVKTVKTEQYEIPTLKTMWTGYREAPIYEVYEANRRELIRHANGRCER